MKFILLVEGHTEKISIESFFKKWLDPQLKHPIQIQSVRFNGGGDFKRKMIKKTNDYLNSRQNEEIIAVIGLLDLYGTDIFPSHLTSVKDRYEWGVNHFEKLVNCSNRFHMFFAVHEYEAWLLSQPGIFPKNMQNDLKKISRPETVNFDRPPAKHLDNLYKKHMDRGYKKRVYGQQLFRKLVPDTAIKKCPYLREMLSTILRLAQEASM